VGRELCDAPRLCYCTAGHDGPHRWDEDAYRRLAELEAQLVATREALSDVRWRQNLDGDWVCVDCGELQNEVVIGWTHYGTKNVPRVVGGKCAPHCAVAQVLGRSA
jgi:hypothetical protein